MLMYSVYPTCIVDAICYVQVPTINQETGILGPEPTETLTKTRSGKVIRPNDKNKNKVSESFRYISSFQ